MKVEQSMKFDDIKSEVRVRMIYPRDKILAVIYSTDPDVLHLSSI